jgi:BMFP domain-containing protein YqiC
MSSPTTRIDDADELSIFDKVELIDSMMKQAGVSRDVHLIARKSLVGLRDEVVKLRSRVEELEEALGDQEEAKEASGGE